MNRYICIHGHFYQPPRENPWLEAVELQDSAAPYHDWNERITAECYAPNTAARLLNGEGRIANIVNNYARISFNFGPTLLSWLEKHAPETHQAIIEADRESQQYFSGHGAALAQVYNHVIMPLANSRDKRTQVIWGVRDFKHRFGRRPEGMWLAETAADVETLEALAEQGITFTILAPRQAHRVRPIGEEQWTDVTGGKVDPKMPYLCRLPSGKSIALFFYDGPISQEVGFSDLLKSGEALAHRLSGAFVEDHGQPQLVHIATDGETYGHHQRHGEMALAYCLQHLEAAGLAKLTIYGEYLAQHPPTHEAEIIENTSWSCEHGIERWRNDCGCNSGRDGWRQQWRAPLRESLDWLRDQLITHYEQAAKRYLSDPWSARDDYISVILDRSEDSVAQFLARHTTRELSREETLTLLRLLEMQSNALLMFTSCGWFFDELSGLETTQVLQYAARALQLAEKATGVTLEPAFIEILQRAPSNLPQYANGAQVYEQLVKPAMVDLLRVGAHYAISSLFEDYEETAQIYCYTAHRELYERQEAGRQKLALGQARLRSNITGDQRSISFAVLHLGDHILMGGVRDFAGDHHFQAMQQEISEAFSRSDVPEIIRLIDQHFETHNYSLWHLFKDEQRKIFNSILASTLEEVAGSFRSIYEHHYPIMQAMREMVIPLPKALATPAEYTINANLRRLLEDEQPDPDQLSHWVEEIKKWPFESDQIRLSFAATRRIESLTKQWAQTPDDLEQLKLIAALLEVLNVATFGLDLRKPQQWYFRIAQQRLPEMRQRAEQEDQFAQEWLEHFDLLGARLSMAKA